MNILSEVVTYLQTNGVGTAGTDLFGGAMPTTPQNCVAVIDTGSIATPQDLPTRTLTFQVIVRNKSYTTGIALANTIRDLLHANDSTNKTDFVLTVGGSRVLTCQAMQEPYNFGKDDNNNWQIASNYALMIAG